VSEEKNISNDTLRPLIYFLLIYKKHGSTKPAKLILWELPDS
jgi:hypothetical protein